MEAAYAELDKRITLFKKQCILPESEDFDCAASFEVQTNKLIELLNDFSRVTKLSKDLDEASFDVLYTRLFRNVSRFLCKRILSNQESKEDAIILQMDIHTFKTIYSVTKYTKEGDEIIRRPHSRFCDRKKPGVSSRAYENLLIYNKYLNETKGGSGYTIHRHFIDNSSLRYISVSYSNKELIYDCDPKSIRIEGVTDDDYNGFLKSLFADCQPGGERCPFEHYLNDQLTQNKVNDRSGSFFYNDASPRTTCESFSCINLGIPGFESWGTLMIESPRSGEIIKDLFLKDRAETELLLDIKNIIFILKKIDYDYFVSLNDNKIRLQANAVRVQATKAAIAQAMARNMSHNIGSHVLSNLIKENAYQALSDEQVHNLQSFKSDLDYLEKGKDVQLSYFLRYLKSRMDYLSEVTFGTTSLLLTRTIYHDVIIEFDRVRILLNYISGIDGFDYRFELLFEDMPMKDRDIAAAFPGDVLGCQAFYNIIENIIRNTAKHTQNRGTTVCITIRFKEIKESNDVEGAEELYCVEIDNGVPEPQIEEVVKDQNRRLNQSVLDVNNNLRDHSLGLLEMKASAAFLRQLDLQEIESEYYKVDDNDAYYHEGNGKKRLNIIKAFKAPTKEGWALGYRFFVQRPKEFLIVGEWVTQRSQKQLLTLGIQLISTEKLKESVESGEVFPHSFLIYEETDQNAFSIIKSNKFSTLLPLRQIPVSSAQKESFLSILDSDNDIVYDIKKGVLAQIKEKALGLTVMGERIKKVVAFMDHGTIDDWKSNRRFLPVVENIRSNTRTKLPMFSVYASEPDEDFDTEWAIYLSHIPPRIHKELIEAYDNKIIIIDERVQKYAEENKEKSIPCWALYASTNVLLPRGPKIVDGVMLPPKDIDNNDIPLDRSDVFPLAPDKFDDYKEKLLSYIDNNKENALLLIHYGILERLFEGDTKEITKYLNKWATGTECPKDDSILTLGNHAKRVVVTSGRGAHSLDLPDTVCFVNLSSVLYACAENRNKYLINCLLYQSRRKKYD